MYRPRLALVCLAIFLLSSIATAQAPTFRTDTYQAATGSTAGVRTDLNQDGVLDFVIVGSPCGTCIIVSNSNGTYRTPVSYNASSRTPLATGDLNGDGNADVVFNGAIAYGRGDGTLRTLTFFNWPGSASRAAVADFNRDGRQDIAIQTEEYGADTYRSRVFVMINTGTGFTAQGPYATETFYHFPEVDLDENWRPMALETGDFDADGRADVIYNVAAKYSESGWSPDHSKIVALFNNGGGALSTRKVVKEADGFMQGVSADLNQDGKSDVATKRGTCADGFCGGLLVFYGSTSRTFTERATPADAAGDFGFPQVADFNGDRRPDVALVTTSFSTESYGIHIATQNADGSFTFRSPYALGAYRSCRACDAPVYYFFAGDFNRDRKPDLAAVGTDESFLRLAINTTAATGFPGCVHPRGRGINICSPASGGSVSSPVSFSIGAADYKPVRKVEVWVDGAKKKETFFSYSDYSFMDQSISLANGSHNASVYAVGYDNSLQKRTFSLNVSGGTCSQPTTSTATVICSPANGSTVSSPVSVQARGGSSITFMEVWVDGTKRYQTSGNTVSTSLTVGVGPHRMTVFGKSGSTVVSKAVSDFTVK